MHYILQLSIVIKMIHLAFKNISLKGSLGMHYMLRLQGQMIDSPTGCVNFRYGYRNEKQEKYELN